MRKLYSLLLLMALVTQVFAIVPNVQNNSGQAVVQGFVYDAYSSLGLEGVTVAAADYNTTTLADGSYTLIVDEGNYDLFFMKEGWLTHVVPALLMVDTLNIDATLQRQPLGFPFTEDWSSGSFETNFWTFEPEQGNWQINDTIGNPEPAVIFTGDSVTTDYSFALVSHEIDLTGVFQNLALYFDLSLITNTPGSQECLIVDIWDGTGWINVDTLISEMNITLATNYFDITNVAAGKSIKLRFLAQGLDASNIDHWLINNIRITLSGSISVNPVQIDFSLHIGVISIYPMTIFNNGLGELEYNIVPVYRREVEPGSPVSPQGLELSLDPDNQPGGEPANQPPANTIILNYDGPNFDAIGLTAGGTLHVAARFPSAMVGQYAGYVLTSVDVYINNVPINSMLKIWGAGTGTSPGPILHQQVFTPVGVSWNNIELSNGVILDGSDIWVGYSFTQSAGQYPAGCDAGPANQNGDWISTDGLNWEHLAGYGLNYNWNIRARINQGPPLWLSTDPVSGTIHANSSEHVDVIFNTTGLMGYSHYYADLYIYSNDPVNPLLIVPVALHTVNYLPEVYDSEWAVCYPVPATNCLHIDFRYPIRNFRILNQFGQGVIGQNAIEKETFMVDTSHLPTGIYFLLAESKDGMIFSQKILISR